MGQLLFFSATHQKTTSIFHMKQRGARVSLSLGLWIIVPRRQQAHNMCSFLLTMSDVDGWIAFSDVSNSCEKGKAKYDTNAQKTRVATPCIAPREEGNGNGLATNAIQSVAACLARERETASPQPDARIISPSMPHWKPTDRGSSSHYFPMQVCESKQK